jgi:hypothetical protein
MGCSETWQDFTFSPGLSCAKGKLGCGQVKTSSSCQSPLEIPAGIATECRVASQHWTREADPSPKVGVLRVSTAPGPGRCSRGDHLGEISGGDPDVPMGRSESPCRRHRDTNRMGRRALFEKGVLVARSSIGCVRNGQSRRHTGAGTPLAPHNARWAGIIGHMMRANERALLVARLTAARPWRCL